MLPAPLLSPLACLPACLAAEGGALYALGLIHTNHGAAVRDLLLQSLRGTQHEVTQHGACLGLGIAGLGTEDEEAFEDVKNVLYMDNAGTSLRQQQQRRQGDGAAERRRGRGECVSCLLIPLRLIPLRLQWRARPRG